MAATSPYQQNDYQAQQWRPSQLPIADIFKGVQVKGAYWDMKARAIKDQYNTALGLDLTLDENKALSKNYLEDARNQMKKLSSMNLNNVDVQSQSAKLFLPLFSDEGISKDVELTKLRRKIYSDAMSFRDKDGGKLYNDDNLIDALTPFQGFQGQTSRQDLDKLYEGAKNSRYVPYYNVTEEMIKLKDKCGTVSSSGVRDNGNYLETYSVSGVSSDKLSGCLELLSPQAQTQLDISGRVQYGRNYQALGTDLATIYSNQIVGLEAQKAENAGKIAGKGKDKLSPDEIAAYTQANDILTTRINNYKGSLEKFKVGDLSEVEEKYDQLAGIAYKDKITSAFANSYYSSVSKSEVDVDQFELLRQKHLYDMELQNERNKASAGKKLKDVTNWSDLSSQFGAGEATVQGNTYDQLSQRKSANTDEFNKQLKYLYGEMVANTNDQALKEIAGQDRVLQGDINHKGELYNFYNYLKGFYKSGKTTENQQVFDIIQPYFNKLQSINAEQNIITDLQKQADDFNLKNLEGYKIQLDNGQNITGNDVTAILNGTHPRYKVQSSPGNYDFNTGSYSGGGKYLYDESGNIVLGNVEVLQGLKPTIDKSIADRDAFLTKQLSTQFKTFNVDGTEEAAALKREVASHVKIFSKTDDLDKYINVVYTDLNGNVVIDINSPKEAATDDEKEDFYRQVTDSLAIVGGNSGVTPVVGNEGRYIIHNRTEFNKIGTALQNADLIQQSAAIAQREFKQHPDRYEPKELVTQMSKQGTMWQMVATPSGKFVIRNANTKEAADSFESITEAIQNFNARLENRQ